MHNKHTISHPAHSNFSPREPLVYAKIMCRPNPVHHSVPTPSLQGANHRANRKVATLCGSRGAGGGEVNLHLQQSITISPHIFYAMVALPYPTKNKTTQNMEEDRINTTMATNDTHKNTQHPRTESITPPPCGHLLRNQIRIYESGEWKKQSAGEPPPPGYLRAQKKNKQEKRLPSTYT